MSFLYPHFLYGIILAGIPLILHLIIKFRYKKKLFPAVILLTKITAQKRLFIKIRNIITLIIKLLIIIIIILLFAIPITSHKKKIKKATIIIDNSLSTLYKISSKNILSHLKNRAINTIKDLKYVKIKTLSGERYSGDIDGAVRFIHNTRAKINTKRLEKIIKNTKDKNIFVFSDFQQGEITKPMAKTIFAYTLQPSKPKNIYIKSINIPKMLITKNKSLKIEITIAKTGNINATRLTIKYPGQKITKTIKLKDQETTTLFNLTPKTKGNIKIKFSIEDNNFPYDNTKTLNINVYDRLSINIISDDNQYAGFIYEALKSKGINIKIKRPGEYINAKLIIILSPISKIQRSIYKIKQLYNSGSSIIVFLNDKDNIISINRFLQNIMNKNIYASNTERGNFKIYKINKKFFFNIFNRQSFRDIYFNSIINVSHGYGLKQIMSVISKGKRLPLLLYSDRFIIITSPFKIGNTNILYTNTIVSFMQLLIKKAIESNEEDIQQTSRESILKYISKEKLNSYIKIVPILKDNYQPYYNDSIIIILILLLLLFYYLTYIK